MQRIYMLMLITGLAVGSAVAQQAGPSGLRVLKMRQKQELQVLKLKQQYVKSSLQESSLPKAVRIQLKHELKREQRKLRQRQKDERQTLKDRERLLKLEMKQLGSE